MKMQLGTYRVITQPRTREGRFSSLYSTACYYASWTWFYTKVATAAAVLVVGTYSYTTFSEANTVYAQNIIVQAPKESKAAVMQRIAGCESEGNRNAKGKQFNANGTIVTNVNTNGTVDVGKYQINMQKAHIVAMAKLGLNPFTEEGNEAYAMYLYENEGTGDWSSSRSCWQ